MTADSRALEILVAKIQKQLAPTAIVEHDVRLPGAKSGRDRQIDVLVRDRIGQYEMLIVLDCKDYAKPVDVKGVEEFAGLLDDVGAHKGALVCPRGFSSAAKVRAKGLKIDLYSPVDTDPHKWQAHVAVPAICDFRSASLQIRFSCSAPKPFALPMNFLHELHARDTGGADLGAPVPRAMARWNAGELPQEPGDHDDLNIFGCDEVWIDNGYGEPVPVSFRMNLRVQRQLYFGSIPLSQISGFRNELSGDVIANAFTLGVFDPREVLDTWQPIKSRERAPVRPVLTLRGLVAHVE